MDGVPIAGLVPAPPNNHIAFQDVALMPSAATFRVKAVGSGTAHFFLWSGTEGYVPVWLTSCDPATNPAPDFGLSACAVTDGGIPPWSPDMSGRVVRDVKVPLTHGTHTVTIPLDAAAYDKLLADGSALVSFETPDGEVQAFDLEIGALGQLANLRTTIEGFGLSAGIERSLLNRVRQVEDAVDRGGDACKRLDELARAIDNQTGRPGGLSAAQAAQLDAAVSRLRTTLGC
jgi:hypothetical protein